jgi:hypothetical protein
MVGRGTVSGFLNLWVRFAKVLCPLDAVERTKEAACYAFVVCFEIASCSDTLSQFRGKHVGDAFLNGELGGTLLARERTRGDLILGLALYLKGERSLAHRAAQDVEELLLHGLIRGYRDAV